MELNIRFVERSESFGGGIHFIVDDECKVLLEDSSEITETQREVVHHYDGHSLVRHLFYFNKSISDGIIERGPISLHCPTCGQNYKVTPDDYESALKRFQKNT